MDLVFGPSNSVEGRSKGRGVQKMVINPLTTLDPETMQITGMWDLSDFVNNNFKQKIKRVSVR
jgi:hypothetical protein